MRFADFSRRVFAAVLSVPVLAGAAVVLDAGPAQALGAGQVCMFNAPDAAMGNGHVGWAFELDNSPQWDFGSTDDDPAGDAYVAPGSYNGAWVRTGTFSAAKAAFRASSIGYTRYRCRSTATSAVGGAAQQANAASGWGYTLIGNNCLDHAYRILSTYRGDVMPSPSLTIIPNNHFLGGLSSWGGWSAVMAL